MGMEQEDGETGPGQPIDLSATEMQFTEAQQQGKGGCDHQRVDIRYQSI